MKYHCLFIGFGWICYILIRVDATINDDQYHGILEACPGIGGNHCFIPYLSYTLRAWFVCHEQ